MIFRKPWLLNVLLYLRDSVDDTCMFILESKRTKVLLGAVLSSLCKLLKKASKCSFFEREGELGGLYILITV